MSSAPVVKVTGVKQLARDLRKFEGGVTELREANQKAGQIVVDEAQHRVPRVSGKLAGTIRATRAPHRVKITGGGARVPYGPVIHWGWPKRNIRATKFITTAAEATQDRWLPEYQAEITRLTNKVHGEQ